MIEIYPIDWKFREGGFDEPGKESEDGVISRSWSEATNTIVDRVIIESESEQIKVMNFGFSDFVTVYLNDKALYGGGDNFMSRDYRFLGTIGYFDTLFLPLRKGVNELWFVVSENFGGWV